MRKKILQLLFQRQYENHAITKRDGTVIFVGSFRQLRRRLQVQFGMGKTEETLKFLGQNGYTINSVKQNLFSTGKSLYNKAMTVENSKFQIPNYKDKLTEIPKEPGVYQFINGNGEVIYVGKAKNLKNRVTQYFGSHDNRPQLPYLMREATDIQYTVVHNELESLFLESTLIKKFLPKYNIMLRDDKNYAFITVNYRTQIPQIGYARKFEQKSEIINSKPSFQSETSTKTELKSKTKYFGPYSAAWKIRNTLNLVRRIFPYCANEAVGTRPCFYYYLHRCPGVCIGKISLEEYTVQLDHICQFLTGNTSKVRKEIAMEMKNSSSRQEFEKAARLRDQLQSLELLDEKQSVILPKPVSWDIISLGTEAGYACINLFKVREGKLTDKENFVYEIINPDIRIEPGSADDSSSVLQTFLEKYYLETSDAPKVIFTQKPPEDAELVGHILQSRFQKKTEISTPQKSKPLELIKIGSANAQEYLKNWLSTQAEHLDKVQKSLVELQEQLHLEKKPERIECYDISNIQGTNPVGSMAVFKNGLPAKSEYRKFKIQGKKTPDDFAMMQEMLTRRLARISNLPAEKEGIQFPISNDGTGARDGANQKSEIKNQKFVWPTPDLIVIDGGKGQLSAACEILEKMKIKIPVIGLAKRIEEIFFPGDNQPLILSHDNPGLQLLQRLRDETHRFGITFHRDLRSKQAVKSALDTIPGIGPKTKKLLKQKFGTVAQIRRASFEELSEVVGKHIAQSIQQTL